METYKPDLKKILRTLNDIALATGDAANFNQTLARVLEIVVEQSHSHSGAIYFLSPSDNVFFQTAHCGISDEHAAKIDQYRREFSSWDPITEVAQTENIVFVPDLGEYKGFCWLPEESAKGHTCVFLPLKSRGRSRGVIALVDLPVDEESLADHILLLELIGHQIGLLIENLILFQEVRSQAAYEERQYLAREIHDDAAQALALIHLQVSTANDLMENEKFEQAKMIIYEMRENVRVAYTDMREAIFSLRTSISQEKNDFWESLKEYLSLYRSYYGVNVILCCDDRGIISSLRPEIIVQISRIIQEALSNARKHASANEVRISFQKQPGDILIIISDDGSGFDLSKKRCGQYQPYGLQIMQERAESINVEFTLVSELNVGTQITLRIPQS